MPRSIASGRLEHLTHIGPKAAASQKAGSADTVACSRCHQDHLGRTASLTKVNDLECGSCHGFGSFGGHPEVALVEKRVPPRDPGLEFNHDRHITEVETKRGAMCETCHAQTANRRGFEPIDFDRHCASCHARQGTLSTDTDFVPAGMLVMPEDVPASFRIMNRPRLEVNARNDNEWIAEVVEIETPRMKIGSSLWLRLYAEFISFEWFVNVIIIHVVKSTLNNTPQ